MVPKLMYASPIYPDRSCVASGFLFFSSTPEKTGKTAHEVNADGKTRRVSGQRFESRSKIQFLIEDRHRRRGRLQRRRGGHDSKQKFKFTKSQPGTLFAHFF